MTSDFIVLTWKTCFAFFAEIMKFVCLKDAFYYCKQPQKAF